jgi:hypothetical protein
MEALLNVAISLLFLGLFFWAINALSALRLQLEDVVTRLERIERAVGKTQQAPPGL